MQVNNRRKKSVHICYTTTTRKLSIFLLLLKQWKQKFTKKKLNSTHQNREKKLFKKKKKENNILSSEFNLKYKSNSSIVSKSSHFFIIWLYFELLFLFGLLPRIPIKIGWIRACLMYKNDGKDFFNTQHYIHVREWNKKKH